MPPFQMNDFTQLGSRLTGDSAEKYVASDDFKNQIIEGFSQMSSGNNPTALIQAQGELMKRGWGPETSEKFLKNALGHLEKAAQQKNFNAVQQENAPVPAFMQSVTPDPRERDSMEQGGFDPALNPSLSKMMPATPEKPLSQNQAMRIAGPGKHWDNLSQVGSFMQVPQHQELLQAQAADQIAQTSERKTLEGINAIRKRELEGMNGQAPAGEPSDRGLALFPSLANRLPQRDKAEDPLLEQRRQLLEAQARGEGARAGYYDQRDRSSGGGRDSNVTTEQEKADPAVMTGTFALEPKTGALGALWGLVGLGPEAPKPQGKLIAERTIARAAEDRGVADLPLEQQGAALADIADEFGFKLSGKPTLRPSSSARTTKTTTRGNQGGVPSARNTKPAAGGKPLVQNSMIRVKEKASGRTGSLPANEFDPNVYEKIQ